MTQSSFQINAFITFDQTNIETTATVFGDKVSAENSSFLNFQEIVNADHC